MTGVTTRAQRPEPAGGAARHSKGGLTFMPPQAGVASLWVGRSQLVGTSTECALQVAP